MHKGQRSFVRGKLNASPPGLSWEAYEKEYWGDETPATEHQKPLEQAPETEQTPKKCDDSR